MNVIEILVAIAGIIYGLWERHQREKDKSMVFGFLRGVKTTAKGNENTTGDTSQSWKALIEQIDDINRMLVKYPKQK